LNDECSRNGSVETTICCKPSLVHYTLERRSVGTIHESALIHQGKSMDGPRMCFAGCASQYCGLITIADHGHWSCTRFTKKGTGSGHTLRAHACVREARQEHNLNSSDSICIQFIREFVFIRISLQSSSYHNPV